MAKKQDSYMSKFVPQSYFFTDPNLLSQTEAQAFGPVSDGVYRLTTKFTLSGPGAPAFAICKGVVLVQPQTGNDQRVNLILRPYTQPISGVKIKYFIYRGLKKSDFFTGDNISETTDNSSDFIRKINASFKAFHQPGNSNAVLPDFLAKYIGYNPLKQPDQLMLSSFFFKIAEYISNEGELVENDTDAFELPLISAGDSLGHFVGGECGIDIVLDYGDYQLPQPNNEFAFDLAYARKSEATIELQSNLGDFEKKLKREQVVQFIDAAAYFGFHCNDGGTVILNGSTGVKKTGKAIYDEVVSKFYTKNKVYLYVQSDRTRSYNFYGNYAVGESNVNALKTGLTETGLTETTYGTMGWPLLIDDQPRANTTELNKWYLQFTIHTQVNAMLYGQVAELEDTHGSNFYVAESLVMPVTKEEIPGPWTKVITLSNPAYGTDTAKLNAATFNILIYQGREYSFIAGQEPDESGTLKDVLTTANFFDDVFDLVNAEPLLKAGENKDYSRLSSERIKLISYFYDKKQTGISAVQTSIVNDVIGTGDPVNPDLNRTTYLIEAVDILNNIATGATVTHDTKTFPSVSGAVTSVQTDVLPEPFYYEIEEFTDDTVSVRGVVLKAKNDTVPNKIILGLVKTENDQLVNLITSNQLINARIFLVDLFGEGSDIISLEGTPYQKYRVGIVAESNGIMKLFMPAEEIIVYSLDRNYHFSKQYSEFMPKVSYSQDYFIIDTVI